jgi:predicted  nucleic acid-binding Zn-ribbon protein
MGEVRNYSDPRRLEEEIQQHESRARELEQQISQMSKAIAGEEVNQRIRELAEQASLERREAASLRQKVIEMMSSGDSQAA